MKFRFLAYCALYKLINLLCLHYLVVFNIIYEKSSSSWREGTLLSLIVDLVVLLNVLQSGVRSIASKYPSRNIFT